LKIIFVSGSKTVPFFKFVFILFFGDFNGKRHLVLCKEIGEGKLLCEKFEFKLIISRFSSKTV
jgi:hypothetical protein